MSNISSPSKYTPSNSSDETDVIDKFTRQPEYQHQDSIKASNISNESTQEELSMLDSVSKENRLNSTSVEESETGFDGNNVLEGRKSEGLDSSCSSGPQDASSVNSLKVNQNNIKEGTGEAICEDLTGANKDSIRASTEEMPLDNRNSSEIKDEGFRKPPGSPIAEDFAESKKNSSIDNEVLMKRKEEERDQETNGSDPYNTFNQNKRIDEINKTKEENKANNGEENEGDDEVEENEVDDDEEGDEEDDEENEPPKLKYSRLTGLPPTFFERDPISTCTFHDNVFIFATHSGVVHLAKPDFTKIRTFRAHRASVLSINTDGQYFATGSMDGTVVIGSISDMDDIIAFDFKRPIHAVVLDRNYKTTRSFISGGMDGKVILSQRNWLRQRVDTVLQENRGPIVSIQMIDDLIMWMNDDGISIYHITTRNLLINVKRPESSPRADLYWPKVHFPETDRILIAWGDHIWSLRASLILPENHFSLSSAASSFRGSQEKKIEVEHVFKLDCLVSGIASFKDDLWMILTYTPPTTNKNGVEFFPPDLKLINSINGEVVNDEEIGLKNFKNLGLNDYHLGQYIGSNSTRYFLVSAKDAVVAQEYSLQDQLNWYTEKSKYFEAWKMSVNILAPEKRVNLGLKHADILIAEEKWDESAKFLSEILYINEVELPSDSGVELSGYQKLVQEYWESWCWIYIHSGHISSITDYIPLKLELKSDTYDSVLNYWLENDKQKFLKLVKQWKFYDIKSLEHVLEEKLESEDDDEIRKCLADLYVVSLDPIAAVPHLIKLKDRQVFEFLSEHHLLTNFFNDLPQILRSSLTKEELEHSSIESLKTRLSDIVQLLIDHRHEISPSSVIKLMNDNNFDFISYFYLSKLSEIDNFLAKPFENETVKLFSLYNRDLLLPFLMKNNDYDIQTAISICEENEFIDELVYLLGKVGQNKKALLLIIDKVDDPPMAIEFTKKQKDNDLWNYLFDYAMSKPKFIRALIECVEDSIDPASIIKRIPENVEIEGLKGSIEKISANNDLNLLNNQLILKTIYNETIKYSEKCKILRLKGMLYDKPGYEDKIDKFQPLVRFYEDTDGKLYTEADIVGKDNTWKHIARTLPEKSTHMAYLKEKLRLKKMNGQQ